MTSGDMTLDEAIRLQKFTDVLACEGAEQYDGSDAPTCLPLCEACLLKWIEKDCP